MEMNVPLPKIPKIVLMFIMNLQRLQQNPSLEINLIDNVGLYYPHDNIVCSHLCDECKKSNELSVTVRASLFYGPENVRSANSCHVQAVPDNLRTYIR